MEFNGKDIVSRIEILLKARKESKKECAALLGKSVQIFTDWKNKYGGTTILKSDDLYILSKHFGVPMEYILTGEECLPDDVAVMAALLTELTKEQREPVIEMLKSQVEFYKKK